MANFSFDKVDRTITILAPDTEVSIQELINTFRDWEDDEVNMESPIIANAYGKQDLGGGARVGITLELINNWRIMFEPRPGPDYVLCRIYGGNLVAINDYGNNPIKPSAFTQVVIAQSSSPTIVEPVISEKVQQDIANKVWNSIPANPEGSFGDLVGKIASVELGRWKIEGSQMIFYAPDNVTEIARFNLYDKFGNLTTEPVRVFERRKV